MANDLPATTAALDGIQVEAQMQSLDIRRSTLAPLCFLLYDILLTTDLEIIHIWRTPWASSKPFYFIARYYSLIALIVRNLYSMTCREWIVYESVSSLVLELSVQLLLILRLFAMYLGSKATMRVMMISFAIQAIIMAICIGLSVPRLLVSPNCVEATIPLELVIYCIVSIMFESFLFSLTLSRYRRAKREGMANLDLMNVLVRDGMLAFGVIFAAMVTNTVLFTLGARTVSTAGFPWLLAILGCAGSRLVLNVREVNRPHKTPSSLGDFEVTSDIYRALDQCDPDDDEADDEVLELKKKLNAPLPLEHQHAADPERRPLAV